MCLGIATLMQWPGPVLAGCLGVTALALVVPWWAERGRRRRSAALARSLELNFHPHDTDDLSQRYRRLTLMREGHDRRAWNVIGGPTRHGTLCCFAYRYDVGFGAERAARRWVVAIVETDGDWGRLALRRCSGWPAEPVPWDIDTTTLADDHADGWLITAPTGHGDTAPPQDVLDRLGHCASDVCLELCDHLVALQAPMADLHTQTAEMIPLVQEVIQRLSAHRTSMAQRGRWPQPKCGPGLQPAPCTG